MRAEVEARVWEEHDHRNWEEAEHIVQEKMTRLAVVWFPNLLNPVQT